MSKFDEISNNGCMQVLVELLHGFGISNEDMYHSGNYVPLHDLQQRRVMVYDDCLSMEEIRYMINRVYSVVTNPGKVEFVSVILDVLS